MNSNKIERRGNTMKPLFLSLFVTDFSSRFRLAIRSADHFDLDKNPANVQLCPEEKLRTIFENRYDANGDLKCSK